MSILVYLFPRFDKIQQKWQQRIQLVPHKILHKISEFLLKLKGKIKQINKINCLFIKMIYYHYLQAHLTIFISSIIRFV